MTIHNKSNRCKGKFISQKALTDLSRNVLKCIPKKLDKNKINELAYSSKFIQRSSSKITGYQFLITMLISSIDPEQTSLEKISDIYRSQFRVRIRAQSIMERLNDNSAVSFVKDIFEMMLKNQFHKLNRDIPENLFTHFPKILIEDSTSCDLNQKLCSFFKGSGGRASKASLKLDVIYDFKAKKFERITLHEGSVADQALANKIIEYVVPNTLIIRDMGFLNMECILKIIEVRAFFLSRMKNNTTIYLNETDIEPLDLAEQLHKHFRKSNVVEMNVCITSKKIRVRLVGYRVPEEVAAERRRKAKVKAKKEGRTLTQKSLTLLDFSLFITNVSSDIWPAGVVGTIYRIRWQIELMFKDWKGRLKIDCLSGVNQYRIQALIYLRLIYILLINEVYMLLNYIGERIEIEVSMHKVYSWLRCMNRLLRIISGRFCWWEERHLDDLILTCMSQQKRKRKTSLQAIYDYDFYYAEAS